MGINVGLSGGKNNDRLAHIHRRNGDQGLVVFSEQLKEKDTLFTFSLNPELGFQMAIDGSFGGTPIVVHDGIDTAAWTGSNVSGNKVTFDDASYAESTWTPQSIEINKSGVGDVWQFLRDSDLDLNNYIAISMDVIVDSGWSPGNSISVQGFFLGVGGGPRGVPVLLEDYFNESFFKTVQKIAIPLEDMSLSADTIDTLRFEVLAKVGAGPVFYLDNIQIEETSGSREFNVVAPPGTKYYINQFKFTYIDGISTSFADNSMPFLSYDKILGVDKLTTGIGFQRIQTGVSLFSASVTCIADSTRGGSVLENVFSDGVNAHVTVSTLFTSPVMLDSRRDDAIRITVNDDLTGLVSFTALAMGHTVDIRKTVI